MSSGDEACEMGGVFRAAHGHVHANVSVSAGRVPTAPSANCTKEDDMPVMTSPKQLFEHELQDMYYAEKALTKVLPTLADEASDRELSQAFTTHLRETEKHVANLEKVFRQIGKSPEAHRCAGIEGIKKEHDDFVNENDASSKMLDAFLTGAAARTEHYEIAAYTGLVGQARALKEREAVELLQQNLKQEKEALKKIETISKRLVKDASNGGSGGSTRSTSRPRTTSRA